MAWKDCRLRLRFSVQQQITLFVIVILTMAVFRDYYY